MAEAFEKPFRREKSAYDQEALLLLKIPKFAVEAHPDNIVGDQSENVKGCRCRPPTEDDARKKIEQLEAKRLGNSQRRIYGKERSLSLATRKRRQRDGLRWTDDREKFMVRPKRRRQTRLGRDGAGTSTSEEQAEESMVLSTLADALKNYSEVPLTSEQEVFELQDEFQGLEDVLHEDLGFVDRTHITCDDLFYPHDFEYTTFDDHVFPQADLHEAGTSRDHELTAQQEEDARYFQVTVSALAGVEMPEYLHDFHQSWSFVDKQSKGHQ